MRILILLLSSYIIGSIPFGYLVARAVKDIDIRQHGSGNIGATNVVRVVGKKWGVLVFLLDFLKGCLAPLLMVSYGSKGSFFIIGAAIMVICGHNWTFFLGFKGGKGVATSLGAMLGIGFVFPYVWAALLISLISWVAVFYLSRYVSLASLSASGAFCLSTFILAIPWEIKIFSVIIFIFIIVRHKANIAKLLQRSENRF